VEDEEKAPASQLVVPGDSRSRDAQLFGGTEQAEFGDTRGLSGETKQQEPGDLFSPFWKGTGKKNAPEGRPLPRGRYEPGGCKNGREEKLQLRKPETPEDYEA